MTPPPRTPSPQASSRRDSSPDLIRDQIRELENHPLGRKICFAVLYYDGNMGTYACDLYKRAFYFTLSSSNDRIIFWSKREFFNTNITTSDDIGDIGRTIAVKGYTEVVIRDLDHRFIAESLQKMINRGYEEGRFT